MEYLIEPQRRVPIVDTVDVLVVGGGPAGLVAAVVAARLGAVTALIERYGFLGGMATAALVGPMAGTRHRYGGGRIIGGVPWELITRMVADGGALLETFDYNRLRPGTTDDQSVPMPAAERGVSPPQRGDVPFDPEALKWVADRMCEEAGVRLRFHTLATAVVMNSDRIQAVIIENKAGRQAVTAHTVVDASGDADIATLAGAPVAIGRTMDGALQPMTLMFRLGGVDTDALGDISRPYVDPGIRDEALLRATDGRLPVFGGPWTFWGSTIRPGEVMVNMVRLWGDATDPAILTRNELVGRAHIREFVRFLKNGFPAFSECFLLDSGPQIGIRETRRIEGEYVLTERDIAEGRRFDDSVALGGHVIDIHSPEGTSGQVRRRIGPYQIPYRCLIPKNIGNLLVAGRPISATHEAHASLRVMGTAMATGQAAGVAAWLASRDQCGATEVDRSELSGELERLGALVEHGVHDK